MNEIDCGVARDLLPLYLDGACGEESRVAVREHLESCEKCRAELTRLAKTLPVAEKPAQDPSMVRAMKNFQHSIRVKRLRDIVLIVVLVIVLIVAASSTYEELFVNCKVELPASQLTRYELTRTSQHKILYDVRTENKLSRYAFTEHSAKEDDELVYYITLSRPTFSLPSEEGAEWHTMDSDLFLLENGKVYSLPQYGWNEYEFDDLGLLIDMSYGDYQYAEEIEPIAKIYAGTENDRVLLWEQGTEIPLCTPSNERRFRFEDVDGWGYESTGDDWDDDDWDSDPPDVTPEEMANDPWYGDPSEGTTEASTPADRDAPAVPPQGIPSQAAPPDA